MPSIDYDDNFYKATHMREVVAYNKPKLWNLLTAILENAENGVSVFDYQGELDSFDIRYIENLGYVIYDVSIFSDAPIWRIKY